MSSARSVLHLVSDSTGATAAAAAAAVQSQFDGLDLLRRTHVFVRSAEAVDGVLERIGAEPGLTVYTLSLIHISEPTRLRRISYAVFCLKKKKN